MEFGILHPHGNTHVPDPQLADIDFLKLLNQDPDIGVAIVSGEGRIVDYNCNAPRVFGADSTRDYHGKRMLEVFEIEFAQERLAWFQEVIASQNPLRVEHLYQGHRMVSTIIPLVLPGKPPCVSILAKRDCCITHEDAAMHTRTQYVDLGPLSKLTNRELEVLILLGHGYSVPEAAKRLFRSPRTIEQHKAAIGRKLGFSAIADIARTVAVHGLKVEDLERQRFLALRPEFQSLN